MDAEFRLLEPDARLVTQDSDPRLVISLSPTVPIDMEVYDRIAGAVKDLIKERAINDDYAEIPTLAQMLVEMDEADDDAKLFAGMTGGDDHAESK